MITPEQPFVRDARPEAISARISYFCAMFGVEPVALRCEDGDVLMTDEFVAWCLRHGAPIDWISVGDPQSMLRAYRTIRLATRPPSRDGT